MDTAPEPRPLTITVTVNPVDPAACTQAALDDDAYYLDLYDQTDDEAA